MSNTKRIISVLLSVAMLAAMSFVTATVPASAAPGDIWWLNRSTKTWSFCDQKITYNTDDKFFTVDSDANAGNSFTATDFLLTNGTGDNSLKPNTTYRIMFDVSSQNKTIDLYTFRIGFYYYYTIGNASHQYVEPSGTGSRIDNLTKYAKQYESGDYKKYHVTVDYTTPAVLSGTQYGVNTYFDLSVIFTSVQNKPIYISNVHTQEIGTYNIIEYDSGDSLGSIHGIIGDDVYDLLDHAGYTIDGYQMYVDPEVIAGDTTDITVRYALLPQVVQNITFDDTYGGVTAAQSYKWHYIPDNGYLNFTADDKIHHSSYAGKGNIGNHSVTLANAFTNSGLEAGATYRLSFDIKTSATPLEDLAADIRFGDDIWTNVIDSATVNLTGEDLAAAVESHSESDGYDNYRISFNVTLPSSGFTNYRNILLGIYGGEYLLDNVSISTTKDFAVVDGSGNPLGTVYGLVGDSAVSLVGALVDNDYTFTVSPATVSTLIDTITLVKTLKANIIQKINFGSDEYIGNSNDTNGHYYSKVAGNKRLIKQETSIKGEGVNVGADFGNRAIVLANNRASSGLVAGNTYRISFKFNSWASLSAFGLQVKFGSGVWNTISAGAATYTGTDFTDLVTTLRSPTNEQSGNYIITLDVTLPEAASWAGQAYRNIIVSLYGTGANAVDYWLMTAYVYSKSTATVTSSDGNYTANTNGFEGDLIGSAISDDGVAKFSNIADRFSFENTSITVDTIIFRGDANADFIIDIDDFTLLLNYLFEKTEAEGADLFGLNVIYGAGNEDIDICDLVALEMILEDISIP